MIINKNEYLKVILKNIKNEWALAYKISDKNKKGLVPLKSINFCNDNTGIFNYWLYIILLSIYYLTLIKKIFFYFIIKINFNINVKKNSDIENSNYTNVEGNSRQSTESSKTNNDPYYNNFSKKIIKQNYNRNQLLIVKPIYQNLFLKSSSITHYFNHENYTFKEDETNYLKKIKDITCGDGSEIYT